MTKVQQACSTARHPPGAARTGSSSETAVATIVAARLETLYGPHRLAYELGRPRSTIYGVLRRESTSHA